MTNFQETYQLRVTIIRDHQNNKPFKFISNKLTRYSPRIND